MTSEDDFLCKNAPASESLDAHASEIVQNEYRIRQFLMTKRTKKRGGVHGVAVAPPGPTDGKGYQ